MVSSVPGVNDNREQVVENNKKKIKLHTINIPICLITFVHTHTHTHTYIYIIIKKTMYVPVCKRNYVTTNVVIPLDIYVMYSMILFFFFIFI